MAVKLYTKDGMSRIYRTYRAVGSVDSGPQEYVSSCGLKWGKEPEPHETCDHIDCAIDVRKSASIASKLILFFLLLGSFPLIMIKTLDIWALAAYLILVVFYILKYKFYDMEKLNVLEEYKRNGTINGMRVYADPALASLIRAFDRAIKLDPPSIAVWSDKDTGLKALNMQAMAAANRAIAFDTKIADAWYLKGMALHGQNKYDEAIAAYDKAVMSYKRPPPICDKAFKALNKFSETDEWHKGAWYKKGLALCMLGRYDEAIYAYNQAIKIKSKDAYALHSKGLALRKLDRSAEADESLKSARNEWNSEGMDLFLLKRYADAIKFYDKALEIDPKFLCAWVNKGTAFYKMGWDGEAIVAFNHAIEIRPQDSHAWNGKGMVLKKIGKKAEARDALSKAKELSRA